MCSMSKIRWLCWLVVFTGPVADENLEPLFSRFVVVAGWTCHKWNCRG